PFPRHPSPGCGSHCKKTGRFWKVPPKLGDGIAGIPPSPTAGFALARCRSLQQPPLATTVPGRYRKGRHLCPGMFRRAFSVALRRAMKIFRLVLGSLLVLPLAGAFAADLVKSAPKPKRKGPLPTVKDVDNAFSGKSDQPRANLYLKLKRAEDGADRPEIVT